MSLFTSLHALAQTMSINILITAEGAENLRVNVTPMPNGKGEKQRWPLSLLAAPAVLDAEFAAAVEVYAPGATSLLDQARACADANQSGATPALPSPSTNQSSDAPQKRGRGRPPKNPKADSADIPPANGDANATDPRQLSIDDAPQPDADNAPAAETPPPTETTSAEQEQPGDDAIDVY
ncbi:PRTRC system protein E [Burkholderia anthina]|uniref:PRTRC system protein E n=1 Tax=Burkholderia anthina TaxID=179879 RepID=UPI001AA01E00|nr:PRTRC system protein E [Burkholderia anthina]QTD91780.1 PRTRC system protein E [Burkholderia anthina]